MTQKSIDWNIKSGVPPQSSGNLGPPIRQNLAPFWAKEKPGGLRVPCSPWGHLWGKECVGSASLECAAGQTDSQCSSHAFFLSWQGKWSVFLPAAWPQCSTSLEGKLWQRRTENWKKQIEPLPVLKLATDSRKRVEEATRAVNNASFGTTTTTRAHTSGSMSSPRRPENIVARRALALWLLGRLAVV